MKIPMPPSKPTPPKKPKKTISAPIAFKFGSCFANKPDKYGDEVEIEISVTDVQKALNQLAKHQEETLETMYGTLRIVVKMDRCGDDTDFFETAEVYYVGDVENKNYEKDIEWYNKSIEYHKTALEKYYEEEKQYTEDLKKHLETKKEKQKIIDEIKTKEIEYLKTKKKMDAEIAEMKKRAGI